MQQIVQLVQNCQKCAKENKLGKEPLISTLLPKYPWQMVLFEVDKSSYLLLFTLSDKFLWILVVPQSNGQTIKNLLKSPMIHVLPSTLVMVRLE